MYCLQWGKSCCFGLSYKFTFQLCRCPLILKPAGLSFALSTLDGDKHLVWSKEVFVISLCLLLIQCTLRIRWNSSKQSETLELSLFFFSSCQVSGTRPEAVAPRLGVQRQQAPWANHQPDHRQTQTHQPGDLSACAIHVFVYHLSSCYCEFLCLALPFTLSLNTWAVSLPKQAALCSVEVEGFTLPISSASWFTIGHWFLKLLHGSLCSSCGGQHRTGEDVKWRHFRL